MLFTADERHLPCLLQGVGHGRNGLGQVGQQGAAVGRATCLCRRPFLSPPTSTNGSNTVHVTATIMVVGDVRVLHIPPLHGTL